LIPSQTTVFVIFQIRNR